MTKNIFLISDLHLNHPNVLKFTGADGKLIRPDFATIEEMHERIITNWNKVVGPRDKVYVLGDVVMGIHKDPDQAAAVMYEIFAQLKGEKVLILGNHDTLHMNEYYVCFKRIYGLRNRGDLEPKVFLSHAPVRMDADHNERRMKAINIHGHIHEKLVMRSVPLPGPHFSSVSMTTEPDPQFVNVCVEQINYTPVALDTILAAKRS